MSGGDDGDVTAILALIDRQRARARARRARPRGCLADTDRAQLVTDRLRAGPVWVRELADAWGWHYPHARELLLRWARGGVLGEVEVITRPGVGALLYLRRHAAQAAGMVPPKGRWTRAARAASKARRAQAGRS